MRCPDQKANRKRREGEATAASESLSQEPSCESRGSRPGIFVPMSLAVSVDVKQH